MSYKINKRYQEFPQYRSLLALVNQGLVHGVVVNFKYIEPDAFFIDVYGAIWKKLTDQNWFYVNRGMNAKTRGKGEQSYQKFTPETLVREMIITKAKPADIRPGYSETSLDFDFSAVKAFRCHKVDKKFCDLQEGDYFSERKLEGIWKKIPRTFKQGHYCNAITKANRKGFRFTWFASGDDVKHFIEDKDFMNPKKLYLNSEDILAALGRVDTNLELNITVKPQVPEIETVATVGITCTKFSVDYEVDESGEVICACSAGLKIGNQVAHITEKDKVVISVKGEKLIIAPVKTVRQGFLIQVTGGCSDPAELPLRLGDSIGVKVTRKVEED